MHPNLKIMKPSTAAQKQTLSVTETIQVTPGEIRGWKLPPFQRPLTVNDKVVALSKQIVVDDGVIPGVMTLGVMKGDRYLIDGQHRRESFLLSGCLVGYCDVRILHVDDMATMAEEFDHLNSRLVNMRPDDYLRAMESSVPSLSIIRRECSFVGYGQVRRNDKSPVLSMSSLLRCWSSAGKECPQSSGGGAAAIARQLTTEETHHLVKFLDVAIEAWGRDHSNHRLWGNLTLTMCMWLYRRTVVLVATTNSRSVRLTDELFAKCLMSVAADAGFADWLVGRQLNDRDRSPAYNKIKAIFVKRLEMEIGAKNIKLPQPSWASNGGKIK